MTRWRRELVSLVTGPRVLKAGVGTGKNLPFYASGLELTALDVSAPFFSSALQSAVA